MHWQVTRAKTQGNSPLLKDLQLRMEPSVSFVENPKVSKSLCIRQYKISEESMYITQ